MGERIVKCKKCDSIWSTSRQVNECPFCGASLIKSREDVPLAQAINRVVSECGREIFDSPAAMQAMVLDYVRGYERDQRLFNKSCQSGLLSYVKEIFSLTDMEQRRAVAKRAVRQLENEAFFSKENAIYILNVILEGLEIDFQIELDYEEQQTMEPADRRGKEPYPLNGKDTRDEYGEILSNGLQLLEEKKGKEAISMIKLAAEHGIDEAAILMGDFYECGYVVKRDWQLAEAYYRQAVDSGNQEAQYKLGKLLISRSVPEGDGWIRMAISAGYRLL